VKCLKNKRIKNSIVNSKSNALNKSFEKEMKNIKLKLDHLEEEFIQSEENLEFINGLFDVEKDLFLERMLVDRKQIKELKSHISNLTASFYEMEYLNNNRRSIKQRLISRFPGIYILFNRKNQSFSIALNNMKGYKAIKKLHLFDIGYYLKNNNDVRLSGADPLIHYIYFGFKEGRKPNPSFDGDYYLKTYADVENLDLNPLIHYSLHGINEGRKTFKNLEISRLPFREREQIENEYYVSIIMPTYNREGIIGRAIDSVLNQTFENYELIIVDDGSTDDTKSLIIMNYGELLKSGKIKYFKQKNFGVSKARNKGLNEAKGDVIAYLDSDNYWLDTFLEKMISSLSNNNKNTAYCSMEVTDDYKDRKFIRNTKYNRNQLLKGSYIDLNVFVHKRFLYDQLGGFDESLTRLVDWDFILRYTRLNEPYFVNEVLTKYYLSSELNNISNNVNLDDNRLKINKLHNNEMIGRELTNLRIGYVLWDFPAFSQTFVINELRWLVENNYDVKVFFKVKPDKEAELNFDIEAIKIKNSSDLAKKINEYKINVLHTHFVYPACTRLTLPAAEKTGVPFTVSAHAIDIFHNRNVKRNKVDEIGESKYCKKIFVLGKFHYDYLIEKGVPEGKLMFLRQATNYNIERAINIESSRFKRKIKNVITVTRFVEKKGIDTLIKAAKVLENEDLIFKIYGYGPLEKDLKNLINELNLKNVVMEGLIKGDEAIKKAYEDGDIFILPCRIASDGDMDGMPTVIFEAMAYGTPIITTNISSIPEFVIDNYNGFIVDPDDPVVLANKISYIKNMDENDLFMIIKHAQNLVQNVSNVEGTVKTMLDIWANNRIDLFMVTHQKGRYKDLETLKDILDRIFKYTRMEFDLTIIDNCSDKKSKDFLLKYAESHPNIRLIFLNENILCGPASNIALEEMDNKYAIYICSNEAFILKHEWELKAINYMKNNENVGIAGTLIYSPPYYNGQTYQKQKFFEKFRNKDYIADKDETKFKHVQGGIYILRREAYMQCGGFNPLLPQDYMDVEYSYYLESKGWRLGEITKWISLTKKTQPEYYTYLDENTTAAHPLLLNDLHYIDKLAFEYCNICNNELVDNICTSCKSDSSERAIYRIIAKSDKIYRSLECTLLLKHNIVHKKFRKMFSLANKRYSKGNINENLDNILENLNKTDILIVNTEFNLNYDRTLTYLIEKLNENGLLIIELSDDELLNDKLKKFLINQKGFIIRSVEFASNKLSLNEFILAEKI